ncbi:MAG: DUF2339 domain-containing protein, partial [Bacteroidia bacterium]|nr:DUF2339 domain-containing protein [Bacteroidia bacterium]
QLIAIAAIFSLQGWDFSMNGILLLAALEVMIFAYGMLQKSEVFIFRVCLLILSVLFVRFYVFIGQNTLTILQTSDWANPESMVILKQQLLMGFGLSCLIALFWVQAIKRKQELVISEAIFNGLSWVEKWFAEGITVLLMAAFLPNIVLIFSEATISVAGWAMTFAGAIYWAIAWYLNSRSFPLLRNAYLLVGQFYWLTAIISLFNRNILPTHIVSFAVLQIVSFCFLIRWLSARSLWMFGTILSWLTVPILWVSFFGQLDPTIITWRASSFSFGFAALGTWAYTFLSDYFWGNEPEPEAPYLQTIPFISAPFLTGAAVAINQENGGIWFALAIFFLFGGIQLLTKSKQLSSIFLTAIVTFFGIEWYFQFQAGFVQSGSGLSFARYFAPLLIGPFLVLFARKSVQGIVWFVVGMYLPAIHLLIATFWYFGVTFAEYNPYTEISLPVLLRLSWVWLGLSLLFLLLSKFKFQYFEKQDFFESYRFIAQIFLGAFLLRHLFLENLLQPPLIFFHQRFWISLAGVMVLVVFYRLSEQQFKTAYGIVLFGSWTHTVFLDVSWEWIPVFFILSAYGTLFWAKLRKPETGIFSIFYYWLTCVSIILCAVTILSPEMPLQSRLWILPAFSIVLLFLFIYVKTKLEIWEILSKMDLDQTELLHKLQNTSYYWIYYPAYLATAIFFYDSFDRSVLTMLWVVECFSIFILALVLRQQHFRLVSMAGLGICVVRLIFWDMQQSNTLQRALVFVGVGLLLLLMNALYNRFKGRFEEKS